MRAMQRRLCAKYAPAGSATTAYPSADVVAIKVALCLFHATLYAAWRSM